ncbi:MAG: DUF86 domain-containing protein [Candidatus Korarchaeota archaeon NZ13-K]|nr:MAG: DUF86 domain-containing protein [Candidatus Korarchaeota archaeon NZ13-K]
MPSPGLIGRIERFRRATLQLSKVKEMSKEEFLSNPLVIDATERNFHVAIEALLDTGSFIISKKGWLTPSRYQEVSKELANHGVLTAEEGNRLSSMAGLRDILVHIYAEVDHEMLYSLLQRVEEMDEIMRKLLKYIEQEGMDP